MAKNYVQDGATLVLIAPAGGATAGVPVTIEALCVMPLHDAAAGDEFTGRTGGVWLLPSAAGLAAGAEVGWLNGELVAAATASAKAFGKLTTDESGGYAEAMLIN
ncbi:capsid cement protein [Oceanimonas smirnovii]|uniref:capsid cement protein n=1 Tax=Oceanimonas smirnovii TaxID=264574 RepID=UPI0003776AC4|nr:capsid cement protein [Oceanimonas smirnovii]